MRYDMNTRREVVRALDLLTANTVPHPDDVDAAIAALNRVLANGDTID